MLECIWPIETDNCCSPPAETSEEDPQAARFVAVVSDIMTRMSGYTIGVCTDTVRPLGACPVCRDQPCCGTGDGIHITGPMGIPVWDVTAVRLGPDEYPVNEYRWDRQLNILWHVPPGRWPRRDERWSNDGEGAAFCVDVVVGTPPDAWALNVAETLVCELMKNCLGEKCRLPKNATTVTAQGVTISLSDDELNTFIPELRAWVHSVNPHGARLPAKVWSPDTGQRPVYRQLPLWGR